MENQIYHIYHKYHKLYKLNKMSVSGLVGGFLKNGCSKISKSSEEEKSSG
ncbi:hypothetical protein LCGC14_0818520 [marine sediment metagenome]|uniref:Uncharacterized protein n=1 Tax=marine sediment metagenome TaxID=412755 RepID=A0A0F9Q4U8_9ZZZZ